MAMPEKPAPTMTTRWCDTAAEYAAAPPDDASSPGVSLDTRSQPSVNGRPWLVAADGGRAAYSVVVAKATGTPATTALTRAKVAFTVHTYEHDPAAASFGLEAATALGIEPARVFKTLLVEADGRLGVGIVPVDRQLDLKAVAAALGAKKAVMADPAVAERVTGYVVGGISPLGQKRALPTVLDGGATAYPTILVSGGRRGLDVELSPTDLLALTRGTVAPISRER